MKIRHVSLRDLFWLVLVVALATGWALDRQRLEAARRNELAFRLQALHAAQQAALSERIASALAAVNNAKAALDAKLGLPPGATKAQAESAMKGHVLGQAKLTGTYRRD